MRVKTEAKRDAIVRAASEVFREMGFEGASMSEIAARAGGSKATLYGYFSSKEELFVAVIHGAAGAHFEPIFAALAKDSDDLERVLQRYGEKIMAVVSSQEIIEAMRAVIAATRRHRHPAGAPSRTSVNARARDTAAIRTSPSVQCTMEKAM